MVPNKIAVFDACILYPAGLRSIMMYLALAELVRARWTNAIHDEWIRNVLDARRDLPREQLERTRRLMDIAIPDSLVRGYESLIDTLILPNTNDRHGIGVRKTDATSWRFRNCRGVWSMANRKTRPGQMRTFAFSNGLGWLMSLGGPFPPRLAVQFRS